jgi:hypothetical protein
VYDWFRQDLRLTGVRGRMANSALPDRVSRAIDKFPEFIELLRLADLGISGVRIVEKPIASSAVVADQVRQLREKIADLEAAGDEHLLEPYLVEMVALEEREVSRQLVFLHGAHNVALDPTDQSDGTIAWTELLMSALWALAGGATLVVDEVDASLHSRLTARLVELFRNPGTNPRGAQLIFTTHDAALLGTNLGDEVLKRDEIWFVEKQDGASRLFPLSDFHPRKGENRERRYLAGSYGAVPTIFEDSLVDSILATRTEDADGEA